MSLDPKSDDEISKFNNIEYDKEEEIQWKKCCV
jgi:hypothetical protein